MRMEKEAIAAELKERVEGAEYFILADYQGLTVVQTETLRGQLGEANARMLVLRNRQFKHILREMDVDGIDEGLSGPTAMFYGTGDIVETSKILKSFAKNTEKPVVKLGSFEGRIVSGDEVELMADLPSKEQLQGMLVGTLAAPLTQLARVMQQKIASIVYVLQAAQDKKTESV